jgi:type IV secretory pathway VirB6-like protein
MAEKTEHIASIGGLVLNKIIQTLNGYYHETYSLLSSQFYNTAVILVTLYIVLLGYLALKGKVGDSLGELIMMFITVPLCFGIFFHESVVTSLIYSPIMKTMAALMGVAMGNDSFSLSTVFTPIDKSFIEIFRAVDTLTVKVSKWDLGMKFKIFSVTSLLAGVYGALYVIFAVLIIGAIFAIHTLIILGPIFGTLAAFKKTRFLFFAWLKSIITYALIPVFTAIVMGITLSFLSDAITDIQNIKIEEDGIFTFAMGSALFIGVMSITLHLKASEFANSITNGQASGLGGFFGTMAGIAAGGAAALRLLGGRRLMKGMGSLKDAGLDKAGSLLKAGIGRAYSKMRGFG